MSALADILIVYGGNAKTIVFTQTKLDANSLILSDKIKQDIEVMHLVDKCQTLEADEE